MPGPILEIGAGGGHSQSYIPDAISIDIQVVPWLDAVADAHALPFSDGIFSNIFMLDVMHHLSNPNSFLREAQRVLAPGGRIVMIEPEITPLSRFFLYPVPS